MKNTLRIIYSENSTSCLLVIQLSCTYFFACFSKVFDGYLGVLCDVL